MDKTLAKQTDKVLFVKIGNDGFDLGAQRREIQGSDFPQALINIKTYLQSVRNGKEFNIPGSPDILLVTKQQLAENGDYNLSMERYREQEIRQIKWPMVELGELITLEYGKPLKSEDRIQGPHPVFGSNGIVGWHDKFLVEGPFIIVGRKGSAGSVTYSELNGFPIDTALYVQIKNKAILNLKYLYYQLLQLNLDKVNVQSGVPGLNRNDAYIKQIPLPPLNIQQEIVSEIEGYQKIIDGARQVVSNYKPQIKIDPEWPKVELDEICDVRDGTHDSPKYVQEGYPLITSKNVKDDNIDFTDINLISKEDFNQINKRSKVDVGDIIMPMIGTIGNPILINTPREFAIKNVALVKFYTDSKIDRKYLKHILDSDYFQRKYTDSSSGSTQKFISLGFIRKLIIPLPGINIQQEIVAQIEKEQQLVDANKQLIQIYEQKTKSKIAEIWET